MNNISNTVDQETSKKAVSFIDSFGINWHGLDNLGEASNFMHSFKGTTERFEKLDTIGMIQMFEQVTPYNEVDEDELKFSTQNIERVLNFLNEVKELQKDFLELNEKPNFIENLESLKKRSDQMNFLNVRAIIYHNCLAS